jgi:hypothetical protein
MVDTTEFYERLAPEFVTAVVPERSIDLDQSPQPQLTDEEMLLCSCEVPAFCLGTKEWGMFLVSKMQPVEFNSHAFDHLVLDATKKSLISSLVKVQVNQMAEFDDVIRGKGKGLIILLYGDPGTGKTLTAGMLLRHTKSHGHETDSLTVSQKASRIIPNVPSIALDVGTLV